jgi:hypothetical protein
MELTTITSDISMMVTTIPIINLAFNDKPESFCKQQCLNFLPLPQ